MNTSFLVTASNPLNAFSPDCGTSSGQIDTAIFHTISEAKHERYKREFPGPAPTPTQISRNVIFAAIQALLPSGNFPTFLEFDATDPNNVVFTPNEGPMPADKVDYSVCLFKGIDALDNPDTFIFAPAVDLDGNATIVFKTLTGGVVKNFYDLSNEHP